MGCIHVSPFKDTLDIDEDVLEVGTSVTAKVYIPPYRQSLQTRPYYEVELNRRSKGSKRILH